MIPIRAKRTRKSDITAEIYKQGCLWYGILISKCESNIMYFDNKPVNVNPKFKIRYITIALTKKGILKKLDKYLEKKVSD